MAEWMENVEKSISRIMADRVYTSSEFKRERDNFHVILHQFLFQFIFIEIEILNCFLVPRTFLNIFIWKNKQLLIPNLLYIFYHDY